MPTTRRHFLQAGAAVAASAQGKLSANDKIRIATIGIGGQGTGDTHASLAVPGVELVSVSDVYEGRLTRAKEVFGNHLFTNRDYREVLARKDIDAVIIATPDHWHAKISIDAMNAGKDVYCEKPMVQNIDDGRAVAEVARSTGRILQVGSQRVSSVVYRKAKELLQSGVIGQLNLVEAWWDRNSALGAWQYSIPPDASTATIDWDKFLGSAPKRPFDPIRLFRWRNYRDYGTGVAGDLFVHLFSGMHFVTGSIGPRRVFASGGLRFWKDGRDVPDVMMGLYDYPETNAHPAFNLALRVNFVNGAGETSGFRFVGSEGTLTIGDGVTVARAPRETAPGYSIATFPNRVQEQFMKKYRETYPVQHVSADAMRPDTVEKYLPSAGYSDHRDHHFNFIEAVRTRKPVVEDASFGLRAAGPALLSNRSVFEKKSFSWDPQSMTVKG